ncbi:alkylation response protein AidB-like acyl-CoA dehydrogenase [Desulfosalsimonas propionicica]|uniref:Alkylation response protein AidB-like acyl-CoA dehydrogenase n=1 Tax=Desulfosalsimonas propionicica TaxID=332175 RepID=A0A7W0HK70_9BACT|nr:acyl-CoA dehydrogenase family protein [Desulfosalsimonas propionicica]MBA2880969.1 alkylation response protein AidB-like acyl-CoA dehydrogenase [Desulfosalsimonas propionicica]
MHFELDKSHKEIQKAVREFVRAQFDREMIIESLKTGDLPAGVRKKAAQLGFSGIHIPDEYDGGGMGLFEYVLAAEQMCRKDASAGMALMLSGFGAECLFDPGRKNLAEKYLPPVAGGKMRAGAALFEPGAGADISGTQTTAAASGDHWIINGNKAYVPNGTRAGFYVVLCATREDADPSDSAINTGDRQSLIIVDADTPGVTAESAGPTLGAGMVDFAHVGFQNAAVSVKNIIGSPGQGLGRSLSFLNQARIQAAAMALGTGQGAFDRALDYTRQRSQFGKKLAQFQVTRHKLADMAAGLESARLSVYQAAKAFDEGTCDAKTAAAAKLTAANAAMTAADEAVQLLGGYGYMTEYEVEHFYRDAKTLEIFLGSPAVLKDVIAGGLIGKLR